MRHGRSGRGFRLKGLKRYRVGGIEYVYHRRTGVKLPADIPETDPVFLEAYMAAEAMKGPPQRRNGPGSVEAVLESCRRSPGFRALSPAYRAQMGQQFKKIVGKGAAVPFSQIQRRHIESDLRDLAPHAATKRLKAWRIVCRFAVGMVRDNDPTEGIKAPSVPKTDGHTPWTTADIAAFRDHWPVDTAQRLAMELIYWTGARMADAVRLGPGMADAAGWLCFVQKKTKGPVAVPFTRGLPVFVDPSDLAHLKAAIRAQPKHMTFMVTAHGHSRSEKAASAWFSKAARTAGLIGKTGHGLRKSRAIVLAEAGATTHQIAAWTGHESLSEVEHYSRAAQKRRLLSGTDGEQKLSKTQDP